MPLITGVLIDRARELRKDSTIAEEILWDCLRDRRLDGFKFMRQFIISPYIVDFVCRTRMLVVELDGTHHAEQIEYDTERTYFLETKGYKVIRFWNCEVYDNLQGTLRIILLALK